MHSSSTGIGTGDSVITSTRTRAGAAAASVDHGSAGGGALYQLRGSGRPMMSSTAAVSATVRVTTPSVVKPSVSLGPFGTRLRLGLRPTNPQHDDGIRIEPPPSLAWAIGAMPDATAARRSPARTSRRVIGIPGIAGEAMGQALGARDRPELGRVGHAEKHEAGGDEALDHRIGV